MCISEVSILLSCHISGLVHEGHITLPLEWDIATYGPMQSPPSQI